MAQKLKDRFLTPSSLGQMADSLADVWPSFDRVRFLSAVHAGGWEELELMGRMHHVTRALHLTLPVEYPSALAILGKAASAIGGFEALCLSDYVAAYGLEYFDVSMDALQVFTRRASAEFAVRAFILCDAPRAMQRMLVWAHHEDADVRRLASEGCRPRLPWGVALKAFQRDPSPILPILEALKEDPSESVRNSVANNLNDIAKDHPDLVLDICERWLDHSARTDRIVRHALRTLLKTGNPRALRLQGLDRQARVHVVQLAVTPDRLLIGGQAEYSFDLMVDEQQPLPVRLELRVDFARPGGKTAREVFQIRQAILGPGRHAVRRRLSLAHQSTRRIYPGTHRLTIVANGQEQASATLMVVPEEQ